VQLDLINLANSLVDAAGAVRGAKVKYEKVDRLAKSGAFTELELATAQNDLETARNRLNLLRSIAEVALQSAEADVARTKQMFEKGLVSTQEMDAGTAKLKMLQLILKGAN
jgi:multidrug resistance efflux pump